MKLLRDQEIVKRDLPAPPTDDGGRVELRSTPTLKRVVAMCLCALGFMLLVGRWATTTSGFAVRRVVVEGAVHANAEALAESTGAVGVNGFRVDLEAVRRGVLADPWIADARVRRVLPHELRIAVTERVPVAVRELGGERSLVDAEGRVIEDGLEPGRFPLPAIVGLDKLAPEKRSARMAHAAASLGALRAASPRLFRVVQELDASSAERLTIVSDSLPPIWIAGPESADEVAGFACRVETVRRALGDVEYVDARWSHRLFLMPVTPVRSKES